MELTNDFEVTVPLDDAWKVLTDVERIAPCMPGAQLKEVEGDEYRGVVKVKVGPITASYRGAARFEELDQAAHRAVLKAEGRETRGQGNASATITANLHDAGNGRTAVSVVTDLNITGKVAQFGRGVLAEVSAKLLDQFVENLETTVLSPAGTAEDTDAPAAQATGDTTEVLTAAQVASDATPESATTATGDTTATPAPVGDSDDRETDAVVEPAASDQHVEPESKQERTEAAAGIRQIDHPEPVPVNLVDVAGGSLAKRLLPYASIAGAIFLLRIVIYAMRRRKA
jgi:carbon monoxide dehydrogenase subunit G